MAEQDFLIGHTQLTAQKRTALRIAGGKPRRVDAVGHDGERMLAKKHLPGLLTARKAVRQADVEKAAHKMIEPPHEIAFIRGIVAVAAPHRNPGLPGHGVIEHSEAAVMPMQDTPLRVGSKQGVQLMQIAGQVVVLTNGGFIDAPAQLPDFIVKKARFIVMIEKVKLHPLAVDGAVDVHDKGFHAASVHSGHNLQHTDGLTAHSRCLPKIYLSIV